MNKVRVLAWGFFITSCVLFCMGGIEQALWWGIGALVVDRLGRPQR